MFQLQQLGPLYVSWHISPQLSELINDDPGPYLCKTCVQSTDSDEIQANLLATHSGSEIFCFTPTIFHQVNVSPGSTDNAEDITNMLSNLTTKLDELATQVVKSQVFAPSRPSYSAVTGRHVSATNHPERPMVNKQPPKQHYDPQRSVIISKIDNPRQYSSSLALKAHIRRAKPEMLEKISQGKLLSSGSIILEANSSDNVADLLDGWPPDVFGTVSTRNPETPKSRNPRTPKMSINLDSLEKCQNTPKPRKS